MKFIVFLLASGKLWKAALSIGSMLLTIWVYASIYGLPFAAGFVGMILVHELGHYFAARQRGVSVSLPAFIPFVGAWINLREQPHDAETEAYIAYAGPFIGTLAAFAAYFYGSSTHSDMWKAVAYSGFVLNLFNLIPVSPLDGGRITQVLSPRIWLLGAPLLVALFFYRPSPMLVLILVMALPNLRAAWHFDPTAPGNAAYHQVSTVTRGEYAFMYLGLAAVLALMSFSVHGGLAHR